MSQTWPQKGTLSTDADVYGDKGVRSPPLRACWLTVPETPPHREPKGAKALTSGSREAGWMGCAARGKEKERSPQKELDLHHTCFKSEETEARRWQLTHRVMQIMHG